MSEDKARLERKIGVSPKGKNEPNQGLSRRGFGKVVLAGAGAAAIAGFGLIRALEENQDRKEGDIFEGGFSGLFEGKVKIKKDAIIYDRPAAWTKYEPEKPFTTNPNEDTRIETLEEGEEFEIKTPMLFFRSPHQFSNPTQVIKIGEAGKEREVDLGASYVAFKADEENLPESVVQSINLSTTKIGCVNMGVPGTIEYQPNGESGFSFRIPSLAVTFDS